MKTEITEDNRRLREFYPDPARRHQVHYAFAHQFLPQYVHRNPRAFFSYLYRADMPGGALEPVRFIHSRWTMFEEMVGLVEPENEPIDEGMVFRRVSDLTLSLRELDGRAAVLVQMPLPEAPTEAFFVGIVLLAPAVGWATWSPDVQARVFTLEARAQSAVRVGAMALICEWTQTGGHHNWGGVSGCVLECDQALVGCYKGMRCASFDGAKASLPACVCS